MTKYYRHTQTGRVDAVDDWRGCILLSEALTCLEEVKEDPKGGWVSVEAINLTPGPMHWVPEEKVMPDLFETKRQILCALIASGELRRGSLEGHGVPHTWLQDVVGLAESMADMLHNGFEE